VAIGHGGVVGALATSIDPALSYVFGLRVWVREVKVSTNPKDAIGDKKPPLHLIPAPALVILSKVMELGAKKYQPYNWRKQRVAYHVYVSAALRHIHSAYDGEDIDPESGQPHLAHAMACLAILLDAGATDNLEDDRPTPGPTSKLIAKFTEKEHRL
jgi:hypothetical protein